jgi:hypothetical protein
MVSSRRELRHLGSGAKSGQDGRTLATESDSATAGDKKPDTQELVG